MPKALGRTTTGSMSRIFDIQGIGKCSVRSWGNTIPVEVTFTKEALDNLGLSIKYHYNKYECKLEIDGVDGVHISRACSKEEEAKRRLKQNKQKAAWAKVHGAEYKRRKRAENK